MSDWFNVRNMSGTGEISIYGPIGNGGDEFAEGPGAAEFNRHLRALGPVREIRLSINSPGGNAFDGLAIHNMLKRHNARVTVIVDGVAASAASLIAMAGDSVVMPSNAMLMVHDPAGMVLGSARQMRDFAEILDRLRDNMARTYMAKSGKDMETVRQWMAEETWFDAEEAVANGLADQIERPLMAAARYDLRAMFKNVPAKAPTFDPAKAAWQRTIDRYNARVGTGR